MPRYTPGDVYVIKLPSGKYRFGRLMQDSAIQIFKAETAEPVFKQDYLNEIDFTVGMYRSAFKDPRLWKVDRVPFATESESWPPRTYVYDPIYDKYSIYDHGEISSAKKTDISDLEPTTVWESQHIIDRITGDIDWVEIGKQAERYRA